MTAAKPSSSFGFEAAGHDCPFSRDYPQPSSPVQVFCGTILSAMKNDSASEFTTSCYLKVFQPSVPKAVSDV
jgi:hypothetical protein